MSDKTLTMLAVGDLILFHPEPESLFALVAPVLRAADVVVGQGEVPFTTRSMTTSEKGVFARVPNPPCDPKGINALKSAGFNVITFATNHMLDGGVEGIEDTLAGLRNVNISIVGAGMNLDEARKPAIIESHGIRFGFLAYNCVGPKKTWASVNSPGCAYLHIVTAYELDEPCPGAPPTIYTFAEPRSLQAMVDDIHKLRPLCDILVTKLHKGVGFRRAMIAMYEQQVSYAAIDAGADLILAEHAHILKGIELYKGKMIFHGLGNFVCSFRNFHPEYLQELRKRTEDFYHIKFDPEDPPWIWWHPEAMMTIIAKFIIREGEIIRVSYLPCLINKQEQPEILKNNERGEQVFDYMDKITKEAGLNARFEWEEDEVVIHQ